MDRAVLSHFLFGIAGMGMGIAGLESLASQGIAIGAVLMVAGGFGIMANAVFQLVTKDAAELDILAPIWLVGLAATLSVLGTILVLID
ncbi:hypothetical protein ACFQJC_00355 [Haloferax namakaokahaiae]|uniref:Uncharacterized protein n=1 Tax=Haloferax namakaokahaiae TaxID=1748331 RepID=A0ABD5Z9M1_9EURY